jgi:hypothetical protein
VPYDPEREQFAPSYRAKQLIVLAADALLAEVGLALDHPQALADELVGRRILPACYRPRYDAVFLERFHNVVELTRNALVSDLPFLANTTEELAAHAIFARAQWILSVTGEGLEEQARRVDPPLPGQLVKNGAYLADEIDSMFAAAIEDVDVLGLFDLPADQDVEEHIAAPGGPSAWSLLLFENWLVPFGGAPRPTSPTTRAPGRSRSEVVATMPEA